MQEKKYSKVNNNVSSSSSSSTSSPVGNSMTTLNINDDEQDESDEDDNSLIAGPASRWWCSHRLTSCCRVCLGQEPSASLGINLINAIPETEYQSGPSSPSYTRLYQLLFESSTIEGQMFDLLLLVLIVVAVITAVLDSVAVIRDEYGPLLLTLEICFTLIFTIECSLRLLSIRDKLEYLTSMMGIIDVTSICPTYLAAFFPSARPLVHLAVLRVLRVLRVFRVLKLVRFVNEAEALASMLGDNRHRIVVFLFTVLALILVIGCAMYLIEGERHGFASIPMSLYWTVVTLTTVGYGDIAPQTAFGRFLATFVMLSGYGIIACPLVLNSSTGNTKVTTNASINCSRCFNKIHLKEANFCHLCGFALRQAESTKFI